jgi:hypothetical protein
LGDAEARSGGEYLASSGVFPRKTADSPAFRDDFLTSI